jgi:Flp pilus assembly protein TadD
VPKPAPAPVPEPVPAAETKVAGAQGLVRQGWRYADKQEWASAEGEFRRALELKGNSGPAHYGLGYVLVKQGRADAAHSELCKAQLYAGSDAALRREISAMLGVIKRECE